MNDEVNVIWKKADLTYQKYCSTYLENLKKPRRVVDRSLKQVPLKGCHFK
jgi:hypothetical protein